MPSRLMPTYPTPSSLIRRAVASSIKVPFVEKVMRMPLPMAYSASWKISGRANGSPPENRMTGTFISAIWSIS
ncbi:hypothetical protein D3C71_1795910 [compost metagenome]